MLDGPTRLFPKTKIRWELPPTGEVLLRAGCHPLLRLVPGVPRRIQVVVDVLHGDPKFAIVVLGTRLYSGDSPLELLGRLAQVEQRMVAIHCPLSV